MMMLMWLQTIFYQTWNSFNLWCCVCCFFFSYLMWCSSHLKTWFCWCFNLYTFYLMYTLMMSLLIKFLMLQYDVGSALMFQLTQHLNAFSCFSKNFLFLKEFIINWKLKKPLIWFGFLIRKEKVQHFRQKKYHFTADKCIQKSIFWVSLSHKLKY